MQGGPLQQQPDSGARSAQCQSPGPSFPSCWHLDSPALHAREHGLLLSSHPALCPRFLPKSPKPSPVLGSCPRHPIISPVPSPNALCHIAPCVLLPRASMVWVLETGTSIPWGSTARAPRAPPGPGEGSKRGGCLFSSRPGVTTVRSKTSERQCSIKMPAFFIRVPDAWGIAPDVCAVCHLTPSLYPPATYMCMKFPGMFIRIYSIF